MELRQVLRSVVRRWWLVLLVPMVALPILIVRMRTQPFQSTVRATVLIPGDTEIPGSSERPELMVLDDLPALVSSTVFAEAVVENLGGFGVDDVHGSISGSRYSRILSITVTGDDDEETRAIAEAAAAVLPEQVNRYLVADPAEPASVNIIDPPSEPTRSRPNQWLILAAQVVVALGVGVGLALLADRFDRDGQDRAIVEK